MNAAASALEYIRLGWSVIPVRARLKRPVDDKWPQLRVSAAEVPKYFAPDSNIGVVLGDVSAGLVDIDLDCPEALELADVFLPATREFGRASARRSHRLYYSRHARTEKFADASRQMLVELRANATDGGEGLQTVFPGSVHESGELIEWDADQEIARITPEALRTAVARIASVALLMRSGWARERAIAFGRTPEVGAIAGTPAAVYERLARWLGFPARTQPPAAPRSAPDNRLKRAAAYLQRIPGAISGAGGHQQAWQAALAVVCGFDLTESDAYALLASEYNPRCTPPWTERELQHKVASAAKDARADRGWLLKQERPQPSSSSSGPSSPAEAPAAAPPGGGWEPPIEFDVFDLPPFPVDALPACLADFVRACSEATQTPLDLCGMLALAASAAACAKRVVVEVKPGYREPLNLFVATILPPGERKSAVVREVSAPLIEWEAKAADEAAPQIARGAQQFVVSKKRLDAATDRAAKAKGRQERQQLELEALDLSEQHTKLTVPTEPRILADDATPEALASLLSIHGGRMAAFSAEGGIFTMMAGKYSDSPSLDVYLKAHAGDEIRVDRKGRPSERVADPALTLGLAVQPAVLDALAEKPMLRGTGLLARFLYALPASRLGSRRVDAPPMSEAVRAAYGAAVRRLLLLQDVKKPIVLKLSPEAYQCWREFAEWIEPQLAEDGEFDLIRDWAGKLAGATARISAILGILGILAINNHSEDLSISIYVQREAMERAITIGRYLVPHAMAAFSSMGASPRVQDAKQLLKSLRRKAWTSFSRRELQQSLKGSERFREADSLDAPIALLVQRQFIREAPQPPMIGPGRRPAPTYEVNPLWVQIPRQNTQNSHNSVSGRGGPVREREPGEDDE